jgi:hypothetical protein
MATKVEKAEAKAAKEKAESVQADSELKAAKAEANKKHVALKCLATSQGQVKKGETFTCNAKELAIFKKHKAV